MNESWERERMMRFGKPSAAAREIWFILDGARFPALSGDTIAVALYAHGIHAWRRSRADDPRGLLCGIGLCFDCLVTVDGTANVRACLTEVREGMVVETNRSTRRSA